jgi:hypothetical protein
VGSDIRQESAKIIPFPRRIGANSVGLRQDHASAPDSRAQPMPALEFGSGWYHQAAIDAERTRKPR